MASALAGLVSEQNDQIERLELGKFIDRADLYSPQTQVDRFGDMRGAILLVDHDR
jgi:hypothetical protein